MFSKHVSKVQFRLDCGRGKIFFGKSMKIYKTNKNMKIYQIFSKSVDVTFLRALWAWQHR